MSIKLIPSRRESGRRVYAYKDFKLVIYGSPKKDAETGSLTYRVEFIQPPLGEREFTIENSNSRKIPNNLITKDLVARLAINSVYRKNN